MQVVKQIRACFITFILLISSLSLFIFPAEDSKAQDLELDEILLILAGFHPYITPGVYVNDGEETVHVLGDVDFDLYYSTSLSAEFQNKDDIKVKIYKIISGSFFPTEIDNATLKKTLQPKKLGDVIQKTSLKIKDMDIYLEPGDAILVTVEIIQSGKPIGNIIERIDDKRLKSNLKRLANSFNSSEVEELNNLGSFIDEFIDILEITSVTKDDIASLVNSFSSSSFVYNSSTYPSSITLPFELKENLTLKFRSVLYDEQDFDEEDENRSEIPIMVELTNKSLNGTAITWPTRIINPETKEFDQFGYVLWFAAWSQFLLLDDPTIPEEEDSISYYLSSEGQLVLNEPEGTSTLRLKLKEKKSWEGISVDRNKIIKNATAELYLYFPKLLYLTKPTINITIFDETAQKPLASSNFVLDHTSFLEFLQQGPSVPVEIELEILDDEIWYNHDISFKIGSTGVPIAPLKSTILLCNSINYPSSINFKLHETENILMTDETKYEDYEDEFEKDIIAGGSAEFIFNISSVYEENLEINADIIDTNNIENFQFDYKESEDISENGKKTVHIYINSTKNNKSAYSEGDYVLFNFNVTGNTGFDYRELYVQVSVDAVEYDIDVVEPKCKEIKHGETGTYTIKIQNNNTGYWPDSYEIEAESENGWDLSFKDDTDTIDTYYDTKEEYVLKVNISVPEFTELSSDELTIKIFSKEAEENNKEENITIIITTKVIAPNVFEHIYHFFELVAEDAGLDEVIGSYAAAFLISIIIFIILIFVIIIIVILRKKYIEIVCLDRIKEIKPDEEANYDITINNPSKKKIAYTINALLENESDSWEVSIDKKQVEVGPKDSVPVNLTVKPTDYIKNEDWVEAKVTVKISGKGKTEEISTVTSVIEGKPELIISGVFHWPRLFNKGDRIETSFRLTNKGNVSASNISVTLLVNGKEKNKVQDITIPRGGYAEIEIPWIAVKGKNKIDIVVK